MDYFEELRKAMAHLAAEPDTLFVGQSVKHVGHALSKTLNRPDGSPLVPMDRRVEMPVVEDFQLGYCTGLALAGFVPISILPRMDFLLLAMNQLVNHLDKIALQSSFNAPVIVRVAVGATKPLHSGLQHTQDHTAALRSMLNSVDIYQLEHRAQIVPAYQTAYDLRRPAVIIEYQDLYSS